MRSNFWYGYTDLIFGSEIGLTAIRKATFLPSVHAVFTPPIITSPTSRDANTASVTLIVFPCVLFYPGMIVVHWQRVCSHCHAENEAAVNKMLSHDCSHDS